jgi:hypothetical protein
MNYLAYGVLPAGPGAPAEGLAGPDGCPVLAVSAGGLTIAYSEAKGPPTPERALAFARVAAALYERGDFVPCRYQLLTAGQVQDELAPPRRDDWRRRLAALAGCAEMGLRVVAAAGQPPAPAATPPPGVAPPGPGAGYLRQRAALYASRPGGAEALATLQAELGRAFAGTFLRLAGEPPGRGGQAFHFLIRRGQEAPFRAAFGRFAAGRAGRFLVSGPWPVYHFAALV